MQTTTPGATKRATVSTCPSVWSLMRPSPSQRTRLGAEAVPEPPLDRCLGEPRVAVRVQEALARRQERPLAVGLDGAPFEDELVAERGEARRRGDAHRDLAVAGQVVLAAPAVERERRGRDLARRATSRRSARCRASRCRRTGSRGRGRRGRRAAARLVRPRAASARGPRAARRGARRPARGRRWRARRRRTPPAPGRAPPPRAPRGSATRASTPRAAPTPPGCENPASRGDSAEAHRPLSRGVRGDRETPGKDSRGSGRVRLRTPVRLDDDVVLDADAAAGREAVDERPVEVGGVRAAPVLLEEHRDEVEPRLDREDHPLLDRPRRPEGGVLGGRRGGRPLAIGEAARHVVHLDAEEVPEAVREERARQPLLRRRRRPAPSGRPPGEGGRR